MFSSFMIRFYNILCLFSNVGGNGVWFLENRVIEIERFFKVRSVSLFFNIKV